MLHTPQNLLSTILNTYQEHIHKTKLNPPWDGALRHCWAQHRQTAHTLLAPARGPFEIERACPTDDWLHRKRIADGRLCALHLLPLLAQGILNVALAATRFCEYGRRDADFSHARGVA